MICVLFWDVLIPDGNGDQFCETKRVAKGLELRVGLNSQNNELDLLLKKKESQFYLARSTHRYRSWCKVEIKFFVDLENKTNPVEHRSRNGKIKRKSLDRFHGSVLGSRHSDSESAHGPPILSRIVEINESLRRVTRRANAKGEGSFEDDVKEAALPYFLPLPEMAISFPRKPDWGIRRKSELFREILKKWDFLLILTSFGTQL